jgi:hypothetical protein
MTEEKIKPLTNAVHLEADVSAALDIVKQQTGIPKRVQVNRLIREWINANYPQIALGSVEKSSKEKSQTPTPAAPE